MSDPIVTMKHLRAAKMCSRGGRALAGRVGLSWQHFLEHGYPASVMEATGNALCIEVAAQARKEAGQ